MTSRKLSLWRTLTAAIALALAAPALAESPATAPAADTWPQWRGPNRDGIIPSAPAWPDTLDADSLKQVWRVPLQPSYSGPIVAADKIFVTETRDQKAEFVSALDRKTGKELWSLNWEGAIKVPFFAKENGDWIRATPAYDGKRLYVPGIRDVLVAIDADTGKEAWRIDFVKAYNAKVPDFGMTCSPVVDNGSLYIQSASSVVKIEAATGKVLWRTLESGPAMTENGAFSSPVIATVAGQRQLVVQTRTSLAGVELDTGKVLWTQEVPNFRGMNILTPVVFNDGVFTSSYQNKSWMYQISRASEAEQPKFPYAVKQAWTNTAQAYMSTPVVVDGHAYLHLGNRRLTCFDLKTGQRKWTSPEPFGRYMSLVANKDKILALDERGILFLLKANPEKFEMLSEFKVSKAETWAHLAVVGDEIFIRELNAMTVWKWTAKP